MAVSLNWPEDRQTEGQEVQALAFIEIPVGSWASGEPHCLLSPASQDHLINILW